MIINSNYCLSETSRIPPRRIVLVRTNFGYYGGTSCTLSARACRLPGPHALVLTVKIHVTHLKHTARKLTLQRILSRKYDVRILLLLSMCHRHILSSDTPSNPFCRECLSALIFLMAVQQLTPNSICTQGTLLQTYNTRSLGRYTRA
jgi:hypothetical protein